MFIIFNKDGSVFRKNQSDYIMQGSNKVNKIFVGFVDNDKSNWTCNASFNLPNETQTLRAGMPTTFEFEGISYNGWCIELTNLETAYNGELEMTLQLTKLATNPTETIPVPNSDIEMLFTYLIHITVNRTGLPLDGYWDNCISVGYFNSFMALLNTKFGIGTTQLIVKALPPKGSVNIVYWLENPVEPNNYEQYMWNGSDYVQVGKVVADLSGVVMKSEKGVPNGVAPLNRYGKVDTDYLVGVLNVVYGIYHDENTFTDEDGQPIEGMKGTIYVDITTDAEYLFNPTTNKFIEQATQVANAINVKYTPTTSGLDAQNVQAAIDELAKEKVNVEPLQWETLPEGTTDKKSFYNHTIGTLRTAHNKIYMFGTTEETPIKEFFDIWGKPTDFKATHVYITIASISNVSSRDSFVMIIHSSNYSNMYFYVVNGYAGQLVGNGSGWISANLLNAERQKKLLSIGFYDETATCGNSLGLIDPTPTATMDRSFTTRITAEGTSIYKGQAIVEQIGGNTIVVDGELKNATPSVLTSIGTNLCDNEFEQGDIGQGQPINPPDKSYIRSKNYYRVIGGKTYHVHNFGFTANNVYVYFYKENKEYISGLSLYGTTNRTFEIPNGVYFVKLGYAKTGGQELPVPTEPKVMLTIGDQVSTEFKPYVVDTLTTEYAKYFPQGMRGVAVEQGENSFTSARDLLTSKYARQVMQVVDLADLEWDTFGSRFANATIPNIKINKTYGIKSNIISNRYKVVNYNEIYAGEEDLIIGQLIDEPKIRFFDLRINGFDNAQIKDFFNKPENKTYLVYELAEPIETEITEPIDLAYNVENNGIETWDSEVPVYTKINYKRDLVGDLSQQGEINQGFNTRITNLENKETEQDQKIADLESDSLHFSPEIHDLIDNKANRVELSAYAHKYHYRGDIHDIELYNQLLAVDDIAKGAMFSVEILTDTPREALNKGFPKLTQGSLVYGWFTTDELGQPMNVITERGMFKIVDGGTLTCEVIDGEDFEIEYRQPSQHQINISTPQLTHLIRGLRVWYQYEYQGRKRLQHQDIYFTDKGDADATSYVSNPLNIVGFFADTIAVEFDMTTGVIELKSTGVLPQSFKIVDLKGLR